MCIIILCNKTSIIPRMEKPKIQAFVFFKTKSISRLKWDTTMENHFDNGSIDFETLDPHKDYCITFHLNATNEYAEYGEAWTEYKFIPKLVDCEGKDNHEAYFLCWKKPVDCSALDGYTNDNETDVGRRRKRSDTEREEASLDKVFNPATKLKYENIAKDAKIAYEQDFKKMNLEKSYKSLFEILW